MNNYQAHRFGFNPKYLKAKHISNPGLALEEFFDDDNLQSHQIRLKEWRDCVISEYYWKGQKNSPAELFYFYELNVRLVEALYLFKLSENRFGDFVNGKLSPETSSEIIGGERLTWKDYPRELNDEELTDPYIVLKSVFAKFDVEEYCSMLSEWLGHGLSLHAANEFVTTKELVGTYENLQKMYAAAFLLFNRKANNGSIGIEVDQRDFLVNTFNLSTDIKGIESKPTPSEKLILEEIKNLMFRRVPSMQMMIHLGSHLPSLTFFILFLIDDETSNPDSNFTNKIEDQCRYLANVQAFVHKVSSAKTALDERRRFWINAFQMGTVIYKNPLLHMPRYDETIKPSEEEAIKCWKRWGDQGIRFFEGAKFYRDAGDMTLSIYLSHQALEYSLKAFILGTTGYNVYMHNVPRLLRLSTLVTNAFIDIIGIDTDDGKSILDLLHGAAVITRHHNYPNIDSYLAETTFLTVQKLLQTIEYIYQKFVIRL